VASAFDILRGRMQTRTRANISYSDFKA